MTAELWIILGFILILALYIVVRQWFVHSIHTEDWDSDSEK